MEGATQTKSHAELELDQIVVGVEYCMARLRVMSKNLTSVTAVTQGVVAELGSLNNRLRKLSGNDTNQVLH